MISSDLHYLYFQYLELRFNTGTRKLTAGIEVLSNVSLIFYNKPKVHQNYFYVFVNLSSTNLIDKFLQIFKVR